MLIKTNSRGAVAGRTVELAIGTGTSRQSCAATTDPAGVGRCAIADVRQPLTADATAVAPPCSASLTVVVLSARALCASVVTTLAPGTATSKASVQQTTIGLPGLPVISLSGVTATNVATCDDATGTVTLTVTVGGLPITVSTAPNTTVALPGGTSMVVNEQRPVAGADSGLSVTAAHLTLPGGLGEVVVAGTTAAVHNCP